MELFVVLLLAIMLDLMGFLTALLVVVFGIGAFLSVIPTVLGFITIGLWGWLRSGDAPWQQRLKKQALRLGTASAAKTISAGLVPSWTIYVLMHVKK